MTDLDEMFDGFHLVEDIGNVEKRRFVQTDIDKCRLHARQDTDDAAPVDVADDAKLAVAFDVEFGNVTVLQQCNPRLVGRGVDDQFLGHDHVSLLGVYIVKMKTDDISGPQ